MKKLNVAYIQGRPGAHPMHRKFAEAVDSVFHFVDFKMRWQDQTRSILYRVTSWFVCAFAFPNRRKYDVFLVDNLHFMPVIMKSLGLISRRQKIVAHMGSHTLYFMYAHRFSRLTEKMHVMALKRYDALICEGKMAADLVKLILGDTTPNLYTIINGVPVEHFPKQLEDAKNLDKKNVLFVGHGPGKERLWYKGLDLMLDAFALAWESDQELSFTIVGDWQDEIKKQLLNKYSEGPRNAIRFVGQTSDLTSYYLNSSLYLHCSRGEAYGLTVLIALAYGIPTIVSEWTGTKEVVGLVDERLICEMQPEKIAKKITWYFQLPLAERMSLSKKGREIGVTYTEERAINDFKEKFVELEKDLGF